MFFFHRGVLLKLKLALKRALSALGLLALLQHAATGQANPSGPVFDVFGDYFVEKAPLHDTQALVHVYRLADADGAVPINIYILGRYHSSLLAGGHVSFCVKPQTLSFQAVFDDAAQLHLGRKDFSYTFATLGGGVHYLRVQADGQRKTTVQLLSEAVALEQIKTTRAQLHSVSRVAELDKCLLGPKPLQQAMPLTPPPPPAAPVVQTIPLPVPAPPTIEATALPKPARTAAPPSTQKLVLGADALFEFGQHQLTAKGKRSVRKLAAEVRRTYRSIDSVRVIGHTDSIGLDSVNKKLSLERAISVMRLLEQEGLRSKSGFEADGLGAQKLIKRSCISGNERQARRAQNIACHARNRRVEIVVTGTRKH